MLNILNYIFDSLVKLLLTDRAEIFGIEYSDILEQVHIQYCKDFPKDKLK
jgi:hypothetical protein